MPIPVLMSLLVAAGVSAQAPQTQPTRAPARIILKGEPRSQPVSRPSLPEWRRLTPGERKELRELEAQNRQFLAQERKALRAQLAKRNVTEVTVFRRGYTVRRRKEPRSREFQRAVKARQWRAVRTVKGAGQPDPIRILYKPVGYEYRIRGFGADGSIRYDGDPSHADGLRRQDYSLMVRPDPIKKGRRVWLVLVERRQPPNGAQFRIKSIRTDRSSSSFNPF